jgi:hypothetical protein
MKKLPLVYPTKQYFCSISRKSWVAFVEDKDRFVEDEDGLVEKGFSEGKMDGRFAFDTSQLVWDSATVKYQTQ